MNWWHKGVNEALSYGRSLLYLGRLPVWLDAPKEEEGMLWVTVPLSCCSRWKTGKRALLKQMAETAAAPEIVFTHSAVALRIKAPISGATTGLLSDLLKTVRLINTWAEA